MLNTKYLIVGAGVTGLAFADWIAGEDYLICEADEEIGGFCKTIHKSGFTWDYSGHFFHFKHPEIESYLLGRMGNEEVVRVRRKSKVFWKNMWIDFPFQKNIHQLPKEDLIDCIYDLHFRSEI